MKSPRLLVIAATIFSLVSSNLHSGESIDFVVNDWDKARELSRTQNKFLFVDAYTDWCHWCKVMDKQTFPDADVVKFVSENFVPLKLEMEHNYGRSVAMKYRIQSYPSFLVFSPSGQLVYTINGYMTPQPFIAELKKSLDAKTQNPSKLSSTIDLNFPDFYRDAFAENGKRKFPKDDEVNAYLDKQTDLTAEVNFGVMVRFASQLSKKFQEKLFAQNSSYRNSFGDSEIKNAINSSGSMLLFKAVKDKSDSKLNEAIGFMERNHAENIEDLKLRYSIRFHSEVGNWKKMAPNVDELITNGKVTGDQINEWAWAIYEKCDDKKVIAKAIDWMKPVVEKKQYATLDTYAALLFKARLYSEARHAAEEAIAIGKSANEDVGETEKLLKKIMDTMK